MDQPWDDNYAPSKCAKHPRWNAESSKPIDVNAARLQKNTTAIIELPYEPGLWLLRAQLLLGLGYPELAAGDAYKARLLVEAAHHRSSHLGTKVRLQYGMCLWLGWHHRWDPQIGGLDAQFVSVENIAEELETGLQGYEQQAWSILIIALQHADCLFENLELAQEAALKFGPGTPDDTGPWSKDFQTYLRHLLEAKQKACERHPEISEDPLLIRKAMQNGTIIPRQYPWMHAYVQRTENTLLRTNTDLAAASNGLCSVRRSVLEGGEYGVFTARPIPQGDEILRDESFLAATSARGRCAACLKDLSSADSDHHCQRCHERYCCNGCLEVAQRLFHPSVCGQQFEFRELHEAGLIQHNKRNDLAEILVLLRLLAFVVRELTIDGCPEKHVLDIGLLNQIGANYKGNVPKPWGFLQAIVLPTRILQSMGIDIFADHRFDTWVIQTIMFRINNNWAIGFLDRHRGKDAPCVQGLYPRHSLFNHSCDPNVSYEESSSHAEQVLKAKRDIEAGEELYIAYDLGLDAKGMNVVKRREALRDWMGGKCMCPRCVRESREAGYSAT